MDKKIKIIEIIECNICSIIFNDYENLEHHLKRYHDPTNRTKRVARRY